jgi:hypothetical protein
LKNFINPPQTLIIFFKNTYKQKENIKKTYGNKLMKTQGIGGNNKRTQLQICHYSCVCAATKRPCLPAPPCPYLALLHPILPYLFCLARPHFFLPYLAYLAFGHAN